MIATPVPAIAISAPASAVPARSLIASLHPDRVLIPVSSSASWARDGISAACAGRVIVTVQAVTIAVAYTSAGGAETRISAAVAPNPAAWHR